MKNIFLSLLIAGMIAGFPAHSMRDEESGADSDAEGPIVSYIRHPTDVGDGTATVVLNPKHPPQPLLVHENAEFLLGTMAYPVTNSFDHEMHYLVGDIDRAAHEKTKASYINFLLLALDSIYVTTDTHGSHVLTRKTRPVLFDRATGHLTLDHSASTEVCTFLSWCARAKKNHPKVIALSAGGPLEVQSRSRTHKVYFYPSNIKTDMDEQDFMYGIFPFLKDDENFDSEVNAIYGLLQNPALITHFVQSLENPVDVLSLGLRYYSFLDMCGKCQKFLELNQTHIKGLFMTQLASLSLFAAAPPPPAKSFLVVAHGNRIYRNNEYSADGQTAVPVSRQDYPYAVSGPQAGTFVNQLPRFAQKLIPQVTSTNRLVVLLHEPDLGTADGYGVVRKHFKDTEEAKFQSLGLTDVQANTLAAKLERANPLAVVKVNLEGNRFGTEESELPDDPVPLTNATQLVRVFEFVSQCGNLQELKVGRNYLFSDAAFRALLRALPRLVNLRVLDLSKIGVGGSCTFSAPIEPLSDSFIPLSKLEVLNLNHNFLYGEGAHMLARKIHNFPKLRELHIAYTAPCFIDGRTRVDDPFNESLKYNPNDFFALASALSTLPELQVVDVRSYNKIKGHLREQIEETDVENFAHILRSTRPGILVETQATKFLPSS